MQPNHHTDRDAAPSPSHSQTSVALRPEPLDDATSSSNSSYAYSAPSAVDEARQMLEEIADPSDQYRTHRPRRSQPLISLWQRSTTALRRLLSFGPNLFRRTDFRLIREMRLFLKHPGHFFWFNRVAPERAAEHFGTTSTDAMTHHARRYGAHTAMLILAVIVVVFGGFSGLATRLMSAYADVPNAPRVGNDLMITGDSRELYVSSLTANTTGITRRIQTITIKDGETLRSIAADRNLSLDTLLWANELIDPDSELKGGQKLVVPPVTGMLHITNPGDTVGKIAEIYGVDPKIILGYKFNNLDGADESTTLKPLQEVMVPGGAMPVRTKLYMYTVKNGDTLKDVSAKFSLKPDTLLDNNDLDGGLRVGQQIRILPVDGLLYTVKKGDTLDAVSAYLNTKPENLLNFRPNNLARGIALQEGTSLIVPGGSWPPPPVEEIVPAAPKPSSVAPAQPRTAINNTKPVPAVAPLPVRSVIAPASAKPAPAKAAPVPAKAAPVQKAVGIVNPSAGRATGSMLWPMHGIIMTYFGERIWYGIHMGLDISTSCGTPVVAADGGTVVESGWSPYGYGINVVLDHGNGIKTRYAHFSGTAVGYGQRVAKGQLVGYEGTTGNSTGCHLHFEVIVNGTHTNPLRWLR